MADWREKWELVIGLEVHTHLKTESKLFSPAATVTKTKGRACIT